MIQYQQRHLSSTQKKQKGDSQIETIAVGL